MKNSTESSVVDDGELNTASRLASYTYDGLNRRVVRAITNSGFLNSTYHDYFNGWSLIEVRDGSDNVLKHQVWGTQYIDELVQVGVNDDPTDATEDDCETFYYALQDANYNVIGLTNSTGDLVERYEYTPYGQRQVFFSPGPNDPDCNAPLLISQRVEVNGSPGVYQPYGLCAFGHQGKMHDEATPGLKYNNQRMYHTRLGRFPQRDPIGYPDGLNPYAGYHILHGGFDAYGLAIYKGIENGKEVFRWHTYEALKLEVRHNNDPRYGAAWEDIWDFSNNQLPKGPRQSGKGGISDGMPINDFDDYLWSSKNIKGDFKKQLMATFRQDLMEVYQYEVDLQKNWNVAGKELLRDVQSRIGTFNVHGSNSNCENHLILYIGHALGLPKYGRGGRGAGYLPISCYAGALAQNASTRGYTGFDLKNLGSLYKEAGAHAGDEIFHSDMIRIAHNALQYVDEWARERIKTERKKVYIHLIWGSDYHKSFGQYDHWRPTQEDIDNGTVILK